MIIQFDPAAGKYMMHCHNLVHEDHDMMAQFEIRDDAYPGDDPFIVTAPGGGAEDAV